MNNENHNSVNKNNLGNTQDLVGYPRNPGQPEPNSIWNSDVQVVENIFTQEETHKIMASALTARKVTFKEIFSQRQHKFDLDEDLSKKVIELTENLSGTKNLEILGCSYAVYQNVKTENAPVRRPTLTEHFDVNMGGPRITLDVQVASNIDWAIVVEGQPYILKDNQAILFSGTNQKHKRELKLFRDDQYMHMLFLHFGVKQERETI
jgi:hypothetical protein